jgi:hypothetical protein
MLNIGRLLSSPTFNQSFIVHRKQGSWVLGRFIESDPIPPIVMSGVVTPSSAKEIMQFPEGDRSTEMMNFYADQPIYTTRSGESQGTSDEIEWHGNKYRILSVNNLSDYGYYKSYGVYMESD